MNCALHYDQTCSVHARAPDNSMPFAKWETALWIKLNGFYPATISHYRGKLCKREFLCHTYNSRWNQGILHASREFFWIIQFGETPTRIAFHTPRRGIQRSIQSFALCAQCVCICARVLGIWVDDNVTAERATPFLPPPTHPARWYAISPVTVTKPFSHALLNSISCGAMRTWFPRSTNS